MNILMFSFFNKYEPLSDCFDHFYNWFAKNIDKKKADIKFWLYEKQYNQNLTQNNQVLLTHKNLIVNNKKNVKRKNTEIFYKKIYDNYPMEQLNNNYQNQNESYYCYNNITYSNTHNLKNNKYCQRYSNI